MTETKAPNVCKNNPQAEPQGGDRMTITAPDRRGKEVDIGYIQAEKVGHRPITWAGFAHKQGGRVELVASGASEDSARTAVAAYVEMMPPKGDQTVRWFHGSRLAMTTGINAEGQW
jgi:hypothetical protein